MSKRIEKEPVMERGAWAVLGVGLQTEDNRAEKVELGFVSRFISLGEQKWKVLL